MKKAVLMLCCLTAAACASNSANNDDDKDMISASTGDWSASISARNSSGVQGTSGVQSAVVGAGANISINGAKPGAVHPWHVHAGTCANTGAIIGSASNYPTLTVGSDGRASANATISAPLTEGNAYSVNVHLSPSQMSTVIACGDLKN